MAVARTSRALGETWPRGGEGEDARRGKSGGGVYL